MYGVGGSLKLKNIIIRIVSFLWDLWELLVQKLKFAKERVQGSTGLVWFFLGFQGLKVVNNPTRLQEVDCVGQLQDGLSLGLLERVSRERGSEIG